jgi:hypothetical protein
VPVGYLIPALLVAACTLFAPWPAPWSHPLARPNYSFGLAANEPPFAAFFWLLIAPGPAPGQRRRAGRTR